MIGELSEILGLIVVSKKLIEKQIVQFKSGAINQNSFEKALFEHYALLLTRAETKVRKLIEKTLEEERKEV